MRKFAFRFETVLKHRTIIEEMKALAFGRVEIELSQCDDRIALLQATVKDTYSLSPMTLEGDPLIRERYLEALREKIRHENIIRNEIMTRLNQARTELVKARQDRESIDRIKQNDLLIYKREALKSEQDILDDIASIRARRREME